MHENRLRAFLTESDRGHGTCLYSGVMKRRVGDIQMLVLPQLLIHIIGIPVAWNNTSVHHL